MRTTVVPAQVTTVEDRITGSLSFSQLLLLVFPVFLGSALFVVLPPFFNYAVYKIVLLVCLFVFCSVMAIRVKGRILLHWVAVIFQYNVRPRYYVANKNDAHLRHEDVKEQPEVQGAAIDTSDEQPASVLANVSTAELVHAQTIIGNPQANFQFKTNKKGELYVSVTEVK